MTKISVACGFCNHNYQCEIAELPFNCRYCHATVELPTVAAGADAATIIGQDELATFFQTSARKKNAAKAITLAQLITHVPKTVDPRYKIVQKLGSGGMGKILLVEDSGLQRQVAMKVLRKELSNQVTGQRFLIEARITARLEHPNIVPIYDLATQADGCHYFTMKHIKGQSLGQWLAFLKQPKNQDAAEASLQRRLQIFLKICQAIAYAHAQGVLHLDLKPQNIMLGDFGEVMVLDWGIARTKHLQGADGRETKLVGTPGYMAPEQAQGDNQHIDPQTDIYGLGMILNELITYVPAYTASNPMALIIKCLNEPPDVPRRDSHGRKVPAPLRAVIIRALAREKPQRYASVAELQQDIQNYLDDRPISARKDTLLDKLGREYRNHLAFSLGTASAMALVFVILFTVGVVWLTRDHEQNERLRFWIAQSTIEYELGKELRQQIQKTKDASIRRTLEIRQQRHWARALFCYEEALKLDSHAPIDEGYEVILRDRDL